MSKRNKILLSLATAVFVVLSLIVSLVVVFAEENEIVRNVNAACRVYDADCHVAVAYTHANQTKDFTISGVEGDDKFLTFDKTDATKNLFQEKMLKPTNDIILTEENNCVVFEFTFANFDVNAFNVTVCLEGVLAVQNLKIEYSKDGIIWSKDNVRFSVAGMDGAIPQEMSYFVRLTLVDGEQDFNFNQDFSITITNKF